MTALPRTRTDLRISARPGDDDDGLLVYDPVSDRGHILDTYSARTFAALDGSVERDELRAIVAPELDPVLADAVIDQALAELTQCGLLDGPTNRGVSRRGVLVGGAIGLAGVVALPLVRSVPRASALGIRPAPPISVLPVTTMATTGGTTPITLTAQNVGDPTIVALWVVVQPLHGTVVIDTIVPGTGSATAIAHYTPNPGYTGPDSFSYSAGECIAAPGLAFPPPSALCPTGTAILVSATPAVVTITVADPPTTTTSTVAEEQSTPRYTG